MHAPEHLTVADEVLRGFGKGEGTVEPHTRKLTIPVAGGAKLLAEVIRELDIRGVEIDDIGLRRPTLDDVFISLTGHAAEAAEENGAGGKGSVGRQKRGGKDGKQGKGGEDPGAAGPGGTGPAARVAEAGAGVPADKEGVK